MKAVALLFHLIVMPTYLDTPNGQASTRDMTTDALFRPFDSGMTFDTEAECEAYATPANLRKLMDVRMTPYNAAAGHACTITGF